MRYQHLLLALASTACLIAACKKDKEGEAPTISIIAPGDGSTVNIPETLAVTVSANDDQRVEHVTVTLLDQNSVAVTDGIRVTPMSTPGTFTVQLPVTSEHLQSGPYTVLAVADDGDLHTNAFRSIHVNAAPYRLRSVLAVTTPNAGSVVLQRIDSTGQISVANTLSMDLCGAAVSSNVGNFFVAGAVTGNLTAFAANASTVRWQVPNLGISGTPYFTSLDLGANDVLYAGTGDGMLRGYSSALGTGVFNASLGTAYRSDQVLVLNELVLCAEHDHVTLEPRLALFNTTSGTQAGVQALNKNVVRMFERDADHVLLFGNMNGHGVVEDRYIPMGGFWEPYTWAAAITAVERIDTDSWLVAFTDGTLARFTYSNAGSLFIGSAPVINALNYDALHGTMLAATEGQVLMIDPQSGQTIGAHSVGGTVRYALPLFNR